MDNVSIVNCVNFLGLPVFDSEQTENSSTRSDIQYGFALEEVCVPLDCILIGIGPGLILEHLLVNVEMRVAAIIVILVAVEGHLRAQVFLVLLLIKPVFSFCETFFIRRLHGRIVRLQLSSHLKSLLGDFMKLGFSIDSLLNIFWGKTSE